MKKMLLIPLLALAAQCCSAQVTNSVSNGTNAWAIVDAMCLSNTAAISAMCASNKAAVNAAMTEFAIVSEAKKQPVYDGSMLGAQRQAALAAYRSTGNTDLLAQFNVRVNIIKSKQAAH